MGRFEKKIINKDGVDVRDLGYYSTPQFIAEYISMRLIEKNKDGIFVLDPAVGKEELSGYLLNKGKLIDSFDIVDYGIKHATNFKKQNFIDYYISEKQNQLFSSSIDWNYDYYIANPPYNCHEIDYIRDNKKVLKACFGDIGANNMYSMFLSAMIDGAKDGALIGVIISDSFLTAKAHNGLRRQIVENCAIHDLLLCPTSLFRDQKADVRTCIMILQKGLQYQRKVNVCNRGADENAFKRTLETKSFSLVKIEDLYMRIGKNDIQFLLGVPEDIKKHFSAPILGDRYKCITGISTGNDKKYLSKDIIDGFSVPFYKNPGKQKFSCKPDAYIIDNFMDESMLVKDFMVRNKQYVFQEGITCSSMGLPFSACYLPKGSTFGVNANIFPVADDIFWLLSYLNSSFITYFVRGVLIRSNMVTSGYISRLPLVTINENDKVELSMISKDVIRGLVNVEDAIRRIDVIIFKNAEISDKTIEMINSFCKNIAKSV